MNDKDEFRQEETDSIQKSIKPDAEYMRENDLCRICHGTIRVCDRSDCPQEG